MRKLIDVIILHESVDLHPSVRSDRDGHTYIEYPPNTISRKMVKCPYCVDGIETLGSHQFTCEYCDGAAQTEQEIQDFPNLNLGGKNIDNVCQMLGLEPDEHGWIPPEQIGTMKQRLLRVKNGSEDFTQDAKITGGTTRVDHSGEVPRITKGPRFYHAGASQDQIDHYWQRLWDIMDWAQKHGCGVSWA